MVNTRKRRKSRLRQLSREHPTEEELFALVESMPLSAPIATAILGAGLVEHDLERLLRWRLKVSDPLWDELVADTGPLRNLSNKILLGHALKIYDANLRNVLDVMRVVRNVFAHTKKLINFGHADIISELRAVGSHPSRRFKAFKQLDGGNEKSAEHAYAALCLGLSTVLMTIEQKWSKGRMRHQKKKIGRAQLVNALLRATRGRRESLEPFLEPFQDYQISDPTTEGPPTNFLAQYARSLRGDRSKGS